MLSALSAGSRRGLLGGRDFRTVCSLLPRKYSHHGWRSHQLAGLVEKVVCLCAQTPQREGIPGLRNLTPP